MFSTFDFVNMGTETAQALLHRNLQKKKTIVILGYARNGKDTVAEMLHHEFGLTFLSPSEFAAKYIVFPKLQSDYATVRECFEDRVNRRALWFKLISEYNAKDKTRLVREILSRSDIYVGIRAKEELEAVKREEIADHIVWVDASKRLPPESSSSCTVGPEDADFILDNNGSLQDLTSSVKETFAFLRK